MRKILGIASLIMSTGVVHAEQLNEQEQISPYSANVTFASQYISRGFQQTLHVLFLTKAFEYSLFVFFDVRAWHRRCKSESSQKA